MQANDMPTLTAPQLAALRRLRTASTVWRHWVFADTLGIGGSTLGMLVRHGLVARRRARGGRDILREYRLTEAGHDAVLAAADAAGVARPQSDGCNFTGIGVK